MEVYSTPPPAQRVFAIIWQKQNIPQIYLSWKILYLNPSFPEIPHTLITIFILVITCGVLETPRFGRKSNFLFTTGNKVTFECNQDFVLVGDQRRTCTAEGRWDTPQYGYTECLRKYFILLYMYRYNNSGKVILSEKENLTNGICQEFNSE